MPPPIEWKKRRPNMHTSRRAWEKSWDDDLDRNWELFGVYDADLWAYFTPESRKNATTTMNDDPRVLKLAGEEDTLCELQVSLAQEAGARFTRDDFENKWRTMDLQKREEIVLGGIYETMTAPGDWEESRRWVPESTLTNLTRDNGEGFLRLVQALMPSALDEPLKEPIFVPHPIVDRVLTPRAEAMSIPGYKSLFRSYQIKRANFLAMLVFNIFYLYREKSGEGTSPRAFIRFHREKIAEAVAKRQLKFRCSVCNRERNELVPGQKLQACSKCWPLGRTVYYCSKDCQFSDWKDGRPFPHKRICGKKLSEAEVKAMREADEANGDDDAPADAEAPMRIPDPAPGYRRSPALLQQLKLLKTTVFDYLCIPPVPNPRGGIFLGMKSDKIYFVVYRTRAFRNGDPLAVQAMFAMCCPFLDKDKFPRERFAQQLKTEYGVDIPQSLIDGVKEREDAVIREVMARNTIPSESEMLEAISEMSRQLKLLERKPFSADVIKRSEEQKK